MSVIPTNDNKSVFRGDGETDTKGQAALLLVESLIHGLVEASVLTVSQAVEIVDVAINVQRITLADSEAGPAASSRAIAALEAIGQSLSIDLTSR